jgi:hypothetical protein
MVNESSTLKFRSRNSYNTVTLHCSIPAGAVGYTTFDLTGAIAAVAAVGARSPAPMQIAW